MQTFTDIFAMPLFPHLFAIPMSVILGVAIGYFLRGKMDETPVDFPRKPMV